MKTSIWKRLIQEIRGPGTSQKLEAHFDALFRRVAIEIAAEVNAKDKDGGTALIEAAYRGHKDVVELLLVMGPTSMQRTNTA